MSRFTFVLALALVVGCGATGSGDPHLLYLMPEMDGVGLCQSPIDISSAATDEGTHAVSFDYMPSEQRIVNTGHTVELKWDAGSTLTFDGKVYEFRQLHFHTPSEHLIDGVTYPLEMHMVHTLEGDDQTYLVGSILFRQGEADPFLAGFLDAVPDEPEAEVVRTEALDLRELRPGALSFYTYQGSLTTPPYTESVTWLVHRAMLTASTEQLERLGELEGNNARHIQPLNDRTVEVD